MTTIWFVTCVLAALALGTFLGRNLCALEVLVNPKTRGVMK